MSHYEPSYNYKATILRWVDGDTVDLLIDLGFYVSFTVRCRLNHIDTPERGHALWASATQYASSLAPVGARVFIYSKLPTDKYGRFLVDIYPLDSDVSVNESLITAGLAVRYEGGNR